MQLKIKNIRISVLILTGLVILSFAFFSTAQEKSTTDNNVFLDNDQDGLSDEEEEIYGTNPLEADTDGDSYSDGAEVKSGYDPLKSAPGDKIGGDKETVISNVDYSDEGNMTNDLMDRVTAMVESSAETGEEVGMTEIESTIQNMLETKISEEDIPEVNKDGIKIKLQDYDDLTLEEQKIKKREDFIKYLTSVTYIISSNSPRAITTELDAQRVFDSLTKGAMTALTTGNVNGLLDIIASAEKSLEQMEDVEVPESEIDLHVKGLTFLNYALTFKNGFKMSYTDPISDLVELSKMQSFIESLASFSFEVQDRFSQYGIDLEKSLGSITNYNYDLDYGNSTNSEDTNASDETSDADEAGAEDATESSDLSDESNSSSNSNDIDNPTDSDNEIE